MPRPVAAPPVKPRRIPQAEVWAGIAAGLKKDGYSGGVVARKMIEEHKMDEAEASALVSRLYGKSVDPRVGDTTMDVMIGLAMVAGGAGGVLVLWYSVGLVGIRYTIAIYALLLGLLGAGLVRGLKALINSHVKEDLRR